MSLIEVEKESVDLVMEQFNNRSPSDVKSLCVNGNFMQIVVSQTPR